MASAQRKALSAYRRRLKRRGVVRIEVHVRKDDAVLVRRVVKALADPKQEGDARALLRKRFGAGKAKALKALLASAPLGGIDLCRDADFGVIRKTSCVSPEGSRANANRSCGGPGSDLSLMALSRFS